MGNGREWTGLSGYRVWCMESHGWEQGDCLMGRDGSLMTLRQGSLSPFSSGTYMIQRSTGKRDRSGREVFEGDLLESHQGNPVLEMVMVVRYGSYEAWCPADRCYMENVGFYVEASGYPQMPLGPLEEYAVVVGNIFENPELLDG